jgi:cephalosporin hydroxylase
MIESLMPIESSLALMSHDERTVLYNLISTLDNNSIIVEVGSHIGGSACLMASVNPTIAVHCMDMHHPDNIIQWELQRSYISQMTNNWYNLHDIPNENRLDLATDINNCFISDPSSEAALRYVTNKYSNITVHSGTSPVDFLNWNQPIDVFFEDALHTNPFLLTNINFWGGHIKPGGYIVGHDYNLELFPDVVNEFNNLIQQGWTKMSLTETLIILQKPSK